MKKFSKILVVLLAVFIVSVAFGQSNIGLNGIGGRLGYVMPEGDVDNTIAFGAVADLGQLTPDIDLEANVTYWSIGEKIGGFDWSWSSFQIDAVAKYKIKMEDSQLRPYVGGGLGLHFGTVKYDWVDWNGNKTDESDSEMDIAIILAGGAKKTLSETLDGFAEIRYTIAGELDTFGFFVGAIYKLNK